MHNPSPPSESHAVTNKVTLVYMHPIDVCGGGERWALESALSFIRAGYDFQMYSSTHDRHVPLMAKPYKKVSLVPSADASLTRFKCDRTVPFAEVMESCVFRDGLVWIQQYHSVPDVIHLLAALPPAQKVALTGLGHEEFDFFAYYRAKQKHAFVEISNFSAEQTRRKTGKATCLYGAGWDCRITEPTPYREKNGFVCVGRILEHKRLDLAIRAIDDEALTIVGREVDQPYFAELRRLGRNKPVTFVLDADDRSRDSIVSSRKALLACSSNYHADATRRYMPPELLGLVIIEAIMLGTLPIASDIPAFEEVMRSLGLERHLFKDNDVPDLRKKLDVVLQMPPHDYEAVVRRAQAAVREQYLWDTLPSRLFSIFSP